jgi:hypothetical protein
MMNDLHDMIQVSCEEAITPDIEAQLEADSLTRYRADGDYWEQLVLRASEEQRRLS